MKETANINPKPSILFSVMCNTKNGSRKINSDNIDSGIIMPTKIVTAIIVYLTFENTNLKLFNSEHRF